MSNEITQDSVFRPQDLYAIGDSNPPVKNGMLASSQMMLTADNQQIDLLFHSFPHYALSGISSSGVDNQFGQKTAAITDQVVSLYIPPFTNRARCSVIFSGSGAFTVKYGSSYSSSYVLGLVNETADDLIAVGEGTPADNAGITFTGASTGQPTIETVKISKEAGLQINGILFSYYRNQYNIT
jgi:hypothetical protein